MNSGKIFEQNFRKSVDKSEIYFLRLKDSPSSFGQDSSFVRFTSSNPYDNFCFCKRTFFPLELKTTKSSSFSFQRNKKERGKNIKLSQINGLLEASRYEGIFAGFVFDFATGGQTVWMDIKNFYRFYSETDKKSINLKDMVEYGCITIDKETKRVNYHYNVSKLLEDIIGGEHIGEKDIS